MSEKKKQTSDTQQNGNDLLADVRRCFSFANYLRGWYEYYDNTSGGDIYENVVNKKRLTEMEIYKEWLSR